MFKLLDNFQARSIWIGSLIVLVALVDWHRAMDRISKPANPFLPQTVY
jgi:hypothetical protein